MKGKVIAIGNQKGGVGKTTTTLNLGVALSKKGYKVLLIDLDPQGNLSTYLKYHPTTDNDVTIYELLLGVSTNNKIDIDGAIHHNESENVDYIPADISLASSETTLVSVMSREHILRRLLINERFSEYDYILIDCLPSLGILFLNATTAADGLIVPVHQKFSLDGLNRIFEVFNQVKEFLNPKLELYGILATMTDNTVLSRNVVGTLKEYYNGTVFNTTISRRVEAAESTCEERSLVNTPKSVIGSQYITVADELLERI